MTPNIDEHESGQLVTPYQAYSFDLAMKAEQHKIDQEEGRRVAFTITMI